MTRQFVRAVLCLGVLVVAVGCVGPNKMKRGLDQAANRRYHKSPLMSQALFPVSLLLNHIAVLGDMLIINPTYWWSDVFRGEGTLHYYEDVEETTGVPKPVSEGSE